VVATEAAFPTLFSGDTVTLSFALSGTPPLWVEWLNNNVPIGTFTNAGEALATSLTLTALQASQGGTYSIIVTNLYGSNNSLTTSQEYPLTVEPYPQFTWFAPQPITTADAMLELFGGATNPVSPVFEATGFGGDNGAGTAVTLDDGQVITFEQVAGSFNAIASGAAPGQVATANGLCFEGDFGTFTNTTGNADFDDVLNGNANGVMANVSSMMFSNLTPGNLYGLQIFATDDRTGNGAPDLIDSQDPSDLANISQSYLLGANDHTLGTFVANETIQTVNMQLPGLTAGGDILTAVVIYSLPNGTMAWDAPTVSPPIVYDGTVMTISEPLLTGIPPFFYQWQANGVNLSGATNPVLTIAATNTSHIVSVLSNYDLVVSNATGTNTSPAVAVTIYPLVPLTITRSSGDVTISWPTAAGTGYVLQTTTSLSLPWTTVTGPYPVVGSQDKVTVSATGTAYYRLLGSE